MAVSRPYPDLEAKLRFLRSSAAFADAPAQVGCLETHMSWVFFGGEHVLKLKKPVCHDFLDFSTLRRREFCCREELRLNARLAPGVYLGLLALQWHDGRFELLPAERLPAAGETVEWLVLMRRLDARDMLDQRIGAGRVTPEDIDALVAVLARFYGQVSAIAISPRDYQAGFAREQAASRQVLLGPKGGLPGSAAALERLDAALCEHAGLLHDRAARSRVLDGHGDLRPEHVCLSRPPVVIDCLEFNAALRQVDPFDEIAFLALECEMAGAPWIGERLLDGCAAALHDRPSPVLMQLYTAHRALLRARLALAHLLDPVPRTPGKWAPRAQRYIQRALRALDALDALTADAAPRKP